MKTNYLLMVLMAAGIICSCEREAVISEIASSQPEISTEVIIHATMAQDGNTKTILQEDGAVFWQPGDKIAVFFNSVKVPFTSFNSVDAASAYFVGNIDLATGHNENSDGTMAGEYVYWGLYPFYDSSDAISNVREYDEFVDYFYGNHNLFLGAFIERNARDIYYDNLNYYFSPGYCSGNQVSTVLYNWQKGVENTFDTQLNISLAKSDDYHELAFYNVLGGVRFSVQSTDITRITFHGNNEEPLAGFFSVQMDSNGKPVITNVDAPMETITLTLPENQAFQPGVWYYMMMFPGTLSKGYTMEVYKGDTKAKRIVNTTVEIKRSTFGSLANVDSGLDFNEEVVYPTGIKSISKSEEVLYVGQEIQLTADVKPANCTFPVQWYSLNPSIVSIDANGVAKGVSSGTAVIFCCVDNKGVLSGSSSFSLKVYAEGECQNIEVQMPQELDYNYFFEGDQVQLTAVTTPNPCSGTLVWRSSDEDVALVDQNGLVTFVGGGNVSIYANIGDVRGYASFYCYDLSSFEVLYGYKEREYGRQILFDHKLVYASNDEYFIIGDQDAQYFVLVYTADKPEIQVNKGDIVSLRGTIFTDNVDLEDFYINEVQDLVIHSSGNKLKTLTYGSEDSYSNYRGPQPVTTSGYVHRQVYSDEIIGYSCYAFDSRYNDYDVNRHMLSFDKEVDYSTLAGKSVSIKGIRFRSVTIVCEWEEAAHNNATIQDVIDGNNGECYLVSGVVTQIVGVGQYYIKDNSSDNTLYIEGLYDFNLSDITEETGIALNSTITVYGKRFTGDDHPFLYHSLLVSVTN